MDSLQKKSSALDAQLSSFSRQIQQLQDDSNKLGTAVDDNMFRR
jgi:hypothetical protein